MKRHQVITLIFFVLTLAISIRVGSEIRSQVSCVMSTTVPEFFDKSTKVFHIIASKKSLESL